MARIGAESRTDTVMPLLLLSLAGMEISLATTAPTLGSPQLQPPTRRNTANAVSASSGAATASISAVQAGSAAEAEGFQVSPMFVSVAGGVFILTVLVAHLILPGFVQVRGR